jgi:hypothetical protein
VPAPGARNLLLLAPPSVTYLLLDRFTTEKAAPLTSPRTAEPGPGTLTLVQVDGQFSISSGALRFPAQLTPAWGDQTSTWGSFARVAGRAMLGTLTLTTSADAIIGWSSTGTAPINTNMVGIRLDLVKFGAQLAGTTVLALEPASTGITYPFAVVMRNTGVFLLVNVSNVWKLLWVDAATTTSPAFPALTNWDSAGALDDIRVTDLGGAWASDYGIATTRLAGSRAAGDTFTHTADCLIEFTNTTLQTSGLSNIVYRQQDASNRWVLQWTNTGSINLYETVAGVTTSRISASGLASGNRVVLVVAGNVHTLFVNNVNKGSYTDTNNLFLTATAGTVNAINDGVVSDVVAWPRLVSIGAV